MSIEGIWTGEIYSPYGWENNSVYVLERGMIMGGNNRHYSTGTYSVTDKTYNASITVHYCGPPRAVFGEQKEEFQIQVTAKVGDGVIEGQVVRPDRPNYSLEYRLTRRIDLPTAPS